MTRISVSQITRAQPPTNKHIYIRQTKHSNEMNRLYKAVAGRPRRRSERRSDPSSKSDLEFSWGRHMESSRRHMDSCDRHMDSSQRHYDAALRSHSKSSSRRHMESSRRHLESSTRHLVSSSVHIDKCTTRRQELRQLEYSSRRHSKRSSRR